MQRRQKNQIRPPVQKFEMTPEEKARLWTQLDESTKHAVEIAMQNPFGNISADWVRDGHIWLVRAEFFKPFYAADNTLVYQLTAEARSIYWWGKQYGQ